MLCAAGGILSLAFPLPATALLDWFFPGPADHFILQTPGVGLVLTLDLLVAFSAVATGVVAGARHRLSPLGWLGCVLGWIFAAAALFLLLQALVRLPGAGSYGPGPWSAA
jgi:hypothetical protein